MSDCLDKNHGKRLHYCVDELRDEVRSLRTRLDQAEKNLADAKESANAHRDAQIKAEKSLSLAAERIRAAQTLFREVLRWREAPQNDAFPHDTRLSIIEWLESYSAALSQPSKGDDRETYRGQCVAWVGGKVVASAPDFEALKAKIAYEFLDTSTGPLGLSAPSKGEAKHCYSDDAGCDSHGVNGKCSCRCQKCAPSPKAGQEGA